MRQGYVARTARASGPARIFSAENYDVTSRRTFIVVPACVNSTT